MCVKIVKVFYLKSNFSKWLLPSGHFASPISTKLLTSVIYHWNFVLLFFNNVLKEIICCCYFCFARKSTFQLQDTVPYKFKCYSVIHPDYSAGCLAVRARGITASRRFGYATRQISVDPLSSGLEINLTKVFKRDTPPGHGKVKWPTIHLHSNGSNKIKSWLMWLWFEQTSVCPLLSLEMELMFYVFTGFYSQFWFNH